MRTILILISFVLAITVHGQDWHSAWDNSGSTWVEKWTNTIDSLGNVPESKRIEILGAATKAASTAGGWKPTEDQMIISNRASALLMAISGHAEYFRDRILSARTAAEGDLNDSNRLGPSFTKFLNERANGFVTLRYLPSVETVRVLGDFLSDPAVVPVNIENGRHDSPLSVWAVRSLMYLPFDPKPVATQFDHEAEKDLPAWQAWYAQVKAGNRTFRFEGDTTEYDLNGPVLKDKLVRIERNQKRDSERLKGHGKQPIEEEVSLSHPIQKPSIWVGLLAGLGLCAAAIRYYLKRRNAA